MSRIIKIVITCPDDMTGREAEKVIKAGLPDIIQRFASHHIDLSPVEVFALGISTITRELDYLEKEAKRREGGGDA